MKNSKKAPARLVRLTEKERQEIGHGTLGRFPTSDIYTVAQDERIKRNSGARKAKG